MGSKVAKVLQLKEILTLRVWNRIKIFFFFREKSAQLFCHLSQGIYDDDDEDNLNIQLKIDFLHLSFKKAHKNLKIITNLLKVSARRN